MTRTRGFLSLIALFVTSSLAVYGQAISGDLNGIVSDPSGAVISGATVTAQNQDTGVKNSATSGSDGSYRIANLPVGLYTLTGTAKGFATATVKDVRITLSSVVTVNLTLPVGTTTTSVEVTEAPAAIETSTAQLQTTFETQQAVELPSAGFSKTVNGAGIWNLSLIGAGVSSQGGVGQGTGPSIAGQRPEHNTFFLDGVSNNNHYSTGPLVYVSNETVAEISLLQNQFSAEFGGGSGGVFNAITKSGSNAIHGTIYEYNQNRDYNAVDQSTAKQGFTSNPRFDNNRLGATVGGPIVKNKLFYFGNFEYNPIGQSAIPGAPIEAPTAAGFTALAGIPGLNQTNLGVFKQYVPAAPQADQGTITVLGVKIPVGTLPIAAPNYANSYNSIVSTDYNMSDKDQIRFRWIYNKSQGIDSNANLPIFFAPQPNNNYLYSLSEFHNFTPTLQNEFRATFSRNFQQVSAGDFKFGNLPQFPNITLDELNGLQIGPDPNTPTGSIQNLFQLQDNVIKTLGRHTIKAGFHFTDVILTNYFIQRVRGDYEYSTLQLFLQDMSPDVLGERSAGPTSYPVGFLQNEAFVNDDWRVRSNLTINLGLRYEYVTTPIASRYQAASAPANVPGGITFYNPMPSSNDWSPRVGFAYSPGKEGVWSIRGGFARAFDLTYANLTSNAAPPYFQQTNDVNLNVQSPNFLTNGGLNGNSQTLPSDAIGARNLVSSYTFGGKRPYGLTWNFGVQRAFHKDYTLEVRYVGTKGVHLWNQDRLNVGSVVSASNYIPTFFSMPSAATLAGLTKTLAQVKSYILPGATASQPYDEWASLGFVNNVVGYAPQAYSAYNGLAVQLNKRYSNNFSYILAYTWSHLIDDATATNFSTYLTPRRAQDFGDLAADKSSSALDRRQRFTWTPIYDFLPFKGQSWFVKNIVGNWTVSGTYTYESPEYATVQSGLDSNLNSDSAGDRVIINPAGQANVGSGVVGVNSLGQTTTTASQIVAYVATNSNARYVVAGSGALANGGRNTFPLHPTNNIDFGIKKKLTLEKGDRKYGLEVGAQIFNLFNHAQYTGGYLSDVSSNGYTGSRNDLIPSNALFGRFDQFYSSNSRQMQLVGRITF